MYNQFMKNDKKLFVISGSSGVGKGTVIKSFLEKNPEFKLSISCTTRQIRPNELEGVNYFYLTKEEFLEWAEFSDNFYGTKKSYVEKKLAENFNIILEIDTKGALQVKEKLPDAVLIFIAPPCYEELENRLRNRHTESEEAIQKRLSEVKFEQKNSKLFDYIITNDTVENAVKQIEKVMENA